jgi:predicted DNA-binding antitoxin AbrB/MazE fold protein
MSTGSLATPPLISAEFPIYSVISKSKSAGSSSKRGSPMSQVFEAVFENGVLRPEKPVVGLSEGQRVWITMAAGEHLTAIREGIDDMEAGRVVAFSDVDSRIRAKLGLPLRSEIRAS